RNKQSKTFKSVCRLMTDIKWIVTGTPVFNSMED
ncbi:MAG: SNF2-related protein, partial [Mariniblastus sp.]